MAFWKRRRDAAAESPAASDRPIEPVLRQEPLESPETSAAMHALPPGAASGAPDASTEGRAAAAPKGADAEALDAAGEAEATKKHAERVAARLRARRRRWVKRLLLAGLLVLLGVGCWQGVELAKTLPVFNFTRLVLEGDLQKVPLSRMKEAVEGAVDGNFFTADLDHVRAAAERVPWVKRASVKRVWPGTLAIEVEVHEAMALYEDGRLVSTQGVLFSANPEEGREARDLPAFYGGAEQVEEIAERYRRFGDILAPLGARITDVILSDRGSWSLVFESDEIPPTKVELGQPEDEEKRAAQLAERSEKRLDEADARMQKRLRQADAAAGEDVSKADAAATALASLRSMGDTVQSAWREVRGLLESGAEDAPATSAKYPADCIDARLATAAKSYRLVERVMGGPPSSIDARYEHAFAAGMPDKAAIAAHAERMAAQRRLQAAAAAKGLDGTAEAAPLAESEDDALGDDDGAADDSDDAPPADAGPAAAGINGQNTARSAIEASSTKTEFGIKQ